MINLIRAELKKLLKNKLFYVILGLILFIAIMGVVEYFVIKGIINNPKSPLMRVNALKKEIDSGAFFGINAPYHGVTSFSAWMLAMAVMASGIAVSDFASGTIKNIISAGKKRSYIYYSKLITIILSALIFLVINIFLNTSLASIFVGWGQAFKWGQLGPIFRMMGVESILFMSIAALLLMVGMVTRNSKLTIGIGFLIPIALEIVEIFCHLFDSLKDIPKYLPTNIIKSVAVPNPTSENILIAITVGIGIVIISTVIGIYTFEKRDINLSDS